MCSDTPGAGERIECTEDATSINDIDLTPNGIDIDTTADEEPGIYGHHEGSGRIFIYIQTGLDENDDRIRNDFDTAGNAELIVTSNARDITAGELVFDGFRIVTPGDFLKEND